MLIDADTLAGRAQHPGELVGFGPVTAELAMEWAADAAWRRWTRDPVSGYLLDYGTVYNPPQALRDFVIARDAVSRFPMSSTRAHRSHLDHAIPFSHGGPTPVRTSAPSPAATRTARNTKPAGSSNCTTTA